MQVKRMDVCQSKFGSSKEKCRLTRERKLEEQRLKVRLVDKGLSNHAHGWVTQEPRSVR